MSMRARVRPPGQPETNWHWQAHCHWNQDSDKAELKPPPAPPPGLPVFQATGRATVFLVTDVLSKLAMA